MQAHALSYRSQIRKLILRLCTQLFFLNYIPSRKCLVYICSFSVNGYEAVAKELLDHGGVDLEAYATYGGGTALFLAVQSGHEAIVKMLLEKGANWQAKDEDGGTLQERAAEYGREAMLKELVDKYAKNSQ